MLLRFETKKAPKRLCKKEESYHRVVSGFVTSRLSSFHASARNWKVSISVNGFARAKVRDPGNGITCVNRCEPLLTDLNHELGAERLHLLA